jgi:hypothetical protein
MQEWKHMIFESLQKVFRRGAAGSKSIIDIYWLGQIVGRVFGDV